MGRDNILRHKTYSFALRVISVYKHIVAEHKEFVLSKQLLRAGTAPGALVRESEFAQSKPDFISKLSIALKEANETEYWISLLKDSDFISQEVAAPLLKDIDEIVRMLVASIKTTKNNIN